MNKIKKLITEWKTAALGESIEDDPLGDMGDLFGVDAMTPEPEYYGSFLHQDSREAFLKDVLSKNFPSNIYTISNKSWTQTENGVLCTLTATPKQEFDRVNTVTLYVEFRKNNQVSVSVNGHSITINASSNGGQPAGNIKVKLRKFIDDYQKGARINAV